MILAIDFDGTLCKDAYPKIGEPNENLIAHLIMFKNKGHKLIQKIKDEEFELTVEENELKVKAKKVKSGFPFNSEISELDFNFDMQYKKAPEGLAKGLHLCSFSTAKDDFKNLNYVCIDDCFIYSTDNYRISSYLMNKGLSGKAKLYIYAECAKLFNNYLDSISHYVISDKYLFLKNNDNSIIAMRTGELNNFADCLSILRDISRENVIELPESITEALNTCKLFIDSDNEGKKKITIELDNKKIKLKSASISGWIDFDLKCNCNMKKSFIINADFLDEILKLTNKMIVCENKALFETDKFSHLIALYTKDVK
jgi:hypothetical protein